MTKYLSFVIMIIVSLFLAKSQTVVVQTKTIEIMSNETERVEDNPELIGGLFEGDMNLTNTFNVVVNASQRWPNSVVRYKIGSAFDVDHALYILKAMKIIESKCCIRFYPALDTTAAFIQILGSPNGCNAEIGYTGRKQIVNLQVHKLGQGCFRIGTILHELLHTLGFYHQHGASERDKYVKIVKENIKKGKESSFRKYPAKMTTNFGIEYDYDSVMHYSAKSYSKNGNATIIPLKNVLIGQRLYLSDSDVQKLNLMYNC